MKTFSFNGRGSEFFKIWIVNILLTIITLGIYYPWAKVRTRRYFYANTNLDDRHFEYLATGKQLLPGFIIGVAFFLIYTFTQQISPIVALIALGIFFLVLPWLIWKSLRFNMKMTTFSNVRFSFHSTLTQSYIVFLLYTIVLYAIIGGVMYTAIEILNLPVWLPALFTILFSIAFVAFITKETNLFKVSGAHYGQGVFTTALSTNKYIRILIGSMLVGILALIGVVLIAAVLSSVIIGAEELMIIQQGVETGDQTAMMGLMAYLPLFGFLYFLMILAFIILLAYLQSANRNYLYAQSNLDSIEFSSTLKTLPYAWIMASNFLLILFTIGFAYPWTKVRMARYIAKNTHIVNAEAIDGYITQQQDNESAISEQIGEVFDVDMDVGF